MPHTHFFFLFGVLGHFWCIWWCHWYFRQRPQNYPHWKLPPFFDIWWKFEVKDQGRVVPVLRGVKKPSFWNWFEVVILVIIVYYTFSILFFFHHFCLLLLLFLFYFIHYMFIYRHVCIYILYIYTYIYTFIYIDIYILFVLPLQSAPCYRRAMFI